jgi:protein AroM
MTKLGMVTVGQSPRTDILPAMMEGLGQDVQVTEKGALDGLSPEEVRSLSPIGRTARLCTRLSNGTEVVVAKDRIIPMVQAKIDALNREGVELIVLLCTGQFPRFESRCLVLEAQKIVDRCVEAVICNQNTMGLVIPLREQTEPARQQLCHITSQITVVTASPYGPRREVHRAAEALRDKNVDLVVMHCMGFTRSHRKIVREITKKPVILANSVVARIIGELLQT